MEIKKKFETKRRPKIDTGALIYGKVPPQDKNLESAVLGAILLEKNAFDLVSSILKPESFYSEANQHIYTAMQMLVGKNMPIDYMTLAEELLKNEHLEIVGGPYAITKLTDSVVSSANITTHARIISEKFIQREIIRIGSEMVNDGYDDSIDVFDLLDESDEKLSTLISGNNQKTFVAIAPELVKSINRIEMLRQLDNDLTGIPSGFNSVDIITHGWQPTDLIILAARPSVGKTAFAGNLVINAAKYFRQNYLEEKKYDATAKPESVIFFSLEMSVGQLLNRMLSCETEIWLDKISNGKLEEHQMKELYKKGIEILAELPVFIDDTPALTGYELRAKCRQLKTRHNLGMIVIDYLQLMSGGNGTKNGNREQEISKISRDLKALAKELQVPIIALSQLSRQPEQRKGDNKMPQLSDLRESGAIEQDADMVMFLYRPEYYDVTANEMGESNKGETHLRIAKHRNGSLANIKLHANLAIQKFTDSDSFEVVKEKLGAGNWAPISSQLPKEKDDLPF